MKPYKLTLLIIVVLMLQVGFLPGWQPLNVVPDLLLAVVICLALYTTATEALICAMVVGLALDISSGADFGLRLGFYTVVAIGVSLLNRAGLALDSLPWRLALAALLTLMANGVILLGLYLHGADLPGRVVASRLSISVVLELIIMMIGGPIVRKLASGGEGMLSMASRGNNYMAQKKATVFGVSANGRGESKGLKLSQELAKAEACTEAILPPDADAEAP